MEDESNQSGTTQADFINEELNFDIDPNEPMTKATLNEHPPEEWIDILGNGQLKKKVIKNGKNGTRPNRSDMCTLKIIGKLKDNTIVEKYEDLKIQLGDVELIQVLNSFLNFIFKFFKIYIYLFNNILKIFCVIIISL